MRLDFIFLTALLCVIAVLLGYLVLLMFKHYLGPGSKSSNTNHTLDADFMAELAPAESWQGSTEMASGTGSTGQEEVQMLEAHPFEDENSKVVKRANSSSTAAQATSQNNQAKLRLKRKLRSQIKAKGQSEHQVLEDQNAE